MKTQFTLTILAFCLSISATAQTITHKRNIAPFAEISLRVPANLHFVQGDENSVEINASQRTLDKLIVEVNDGKLVLRFSFEDQWINDFKPGPIGITVVSPKMYGLSVLGSGNIYARDFETHTLEVNIAGSGDIHLEGLQCDQLNATITGSGDVLFEGPSTGKQIKVLIAGSGDVKAGKFASEAAHIKIAGSGDCEIAVSQYLDVNIYGSGDVTYEGNPSIKSNIAGSGRVSKK